jgi:hypothetical protein
LSPGGTVSGWRGDAAQFLEDAEEVAATADWIGVNCHWTDPSGLNSLSGGRIFEEYRLRFPSKLLFVTEFNNPSAGVSNHTKAREYLEFYRMLRERPGIAAAFGYALSAVSGHEAVVWRGENGSRSVVAETIGGRTF